MAQAIIRLRRLVSQAMPHSGFVPYWMETSINQPKGETNMQTTNRKLRKLTPDDRDILAQVFKDQGRAWTYKALAVWFGAIPYKALNRFRWNDKRLAAFRFLRAIIEDYSFDAIYSAANAIRPSKHPAEQTK